MQMISRKHLFELAGTSELGESTSQEFDYNQFKTIWKKTNDEIKTKPKSKYTDVYFETYDLLKKTWLEEHQDDIKFVGEGSSRVAFALDGGKCLKIAKTNAGIAQNRQEVNNFKKGNYLCFTQIYDYDTSGYTSVLTECCAEARDKDFMKLFEIDAYELSKELEKVFIADSKFKNINKIISFYEKRKNSLEVSQLNFWNNCVKNRSPQWDVMRSLIDFYEKNGSGHLLPVDLNSPMNWGLAIRKETLVLVILDYGFSTRVGRKYYSVS